MRQNVLLKRERDRNNVRLLKLNIYPFRLSLISIGVSASNLVVEEALSRLGISEEGLEVVGLGQQVLSALPHPAQILPACVQSLQPLCQEHMLSVRLALSHLHTHITVNEHAVFNNTSRYFIC